MKREAGEVIMKFSACWGYVVESVNGFFENI